MVAHGPSTCLPGATTRRVACIESCRSILMEEIAIPALVLNATRMIARLVLLSVETRIWVGAR
jgi:hypothetical protein